MAKQSGTTSGTRMLMQIPLIYLDIYYKDIPSLCTVNKQLNSLLCNNPLYWKLKTRQDFDLPKDIPESWKMYYVSIAKTKEAKFIPTYLKADYESIISACDTKRDVYALICNNENFWKLKVERDFGSPDKTPIKWRKLYGLLYSQTKPIIVMGRNNKGQLGVSEETLNKNNVLVYNELVETNVAKPFASGFRVKDVVCGPENTFVIDAYSNVLATGDNNKGQLGFGDRVNRNVFIKIPNMKAKKVAAGDNFTLFLDINDFLWGCGDNTYGQLGYSNKNIILTPMKLSTKKFTKISAGYNHGAAIDDDGFVFTFGDNTYGQLGIEDKNQGNAIYKTDVTGNNVACGKNHTLVLSEQNTVYIMGDNKEGQLGFIGDLSEEIEEIRDYNAVDVFAGGNNSYILRSDKTVVSSGNNSDGQLGMGMTYYKDEEGDKVDNPNLGFPIDEPDQDDIMDNRAAFEDVLLTEYNSQTHTEINVPFEIKTMSIAQKHISYVNEKGDVYVVGDNLYQQTGLGMEEDPYNDFTGTVQEITKLPNIKGWKVSCGRDHTAILGDKE